MFSNLETRRRRTAAVGAVAVLLLLAMTAAAGAAGEPPVGGDATTVEPGGAGTVPLAGAVPEWLTPELEAQVLASPGTPVPAPLDAPLPSEVGIRPGAWMVSPAGCTMNFVFTTTTSYAIGTAGHCVSDARDEEVVLLTLAPGTGDPVLVAIGTPSLVRDAGVGDDFALVPVRAALHDWVSPTAAVLAGPCGQRAGALGDTVWHYGHGLAIGSGGTPRAGLSLWHEDDAFYWSSPAIFGDSGSFVRLADLAAAGNLTHLVVDTDHPGTVVAGTTMARISELAGRWRLATSPLCP